MPGDATRQRRIARLSVAGGRRRGTGFAIDARHLLTAFHVVGKRPTGTVEPGPIAVAFQDAEDPAHWRDTTATYVQGDAGLDWALLRCDTDVADLAPIALARPRAGYGDPWRTYGYPGAATDLGKTFDGDITAHEPEIQLHCRQSFQGARVPGLSGAPCLVGDRAIGVIVSASDPDDSGYNRDGAMFVRSLAAIAEACAEVRALLPAHAPPFVPQVESVLADDRVVPLLPELGKLGADWTLPPVAAADRPQLAPRAAEQLLRAGPTRAVPALRVLYPLGVEPSIAILGFAASAWIDDAACGVLAAAVRAGRDATIIGLNAATPDLGRRYVHRAGYPTASHPGWLSTMAVLPDPAGERRDDTLLALARDALRGLLGCEEDDPIEAIDAAYAAHVTPLAPGVVPDPLVLVVPPPVPPAAAVAKLHAAYAKVCLVLLCGTRGLAELKVRFPDVVLVEPPVVDEQEQRARAAHDAACLAITSFHKRLRRAP